MSNHRDIPKVPVASEHRFIALQCSRRDHRVILVDAWTLALIGVGQALAEQAASAPSNAGCQIR